MCSLAFFLLSPVCLADTIFLVNDDHISGDIQELNDNLLIVKTTYAGMISIERNAIRSFSTESPHNWKIDQSTRPVKLVASTTAGHVLVNNQVVAISKLNLTNITAEARWQKSGNMDVALDVEDKDNHTKKLHLYGELNLESKKWRHRFKVEGKKEKENNRKTEDNSELNYTLDYFFNEHWLLRGEASYREDKLLNGHRYTYAGFGPGYRFWGDDRDKLDFITSYNHFWISSKITTIELDAWAAALNYNQHWFDGKLETYSDLQIAYPNISGIDYIENTTIGLRYLLTQHVYLSLKYDLNETKISTATLKDSSYTLGAGVKF